MQQRSEVYVKIQRKCWGGGGGGRVGWGGGQGGCKRRIEVFVIFLWGGLVRSGGGGRVRVDVNEELKFLRKFTKNREGGRGCSGWGVFGLGVRVDVNEELKFLRKFTKKFGGLGGGGVRWGVGLVGVRVDVNAMLG